MKLKSSNEKIQINEEGHVGLEWEDLGDMSHYGGETLIYLYFIIVELSGFLSLVFAMTTISIYNKIFEGMFYSYYVFIACNCSVFVYPFLVPVIKKKLHFRSQVYLLLGNGIVWVFVFAGIGIWMPNSRLGFYLMMAGNFIAKTVAYSSETVIVESYKFYPSSILKFNLSGFSLISLFYSIILIPMSYYEVSHIIQILLIVLLSAMCSAFAFVLHERVLRTNYYYEKMSHSKTFNERSTAAQILKEMRTVWPYILICLLMVSAYAVIFPSLASDIGPSWINKSTWTNIIIFTGSIMNILSNAFTFSCLESDLVQFFLSFLSISYSVYQCLSFIKVISPIDNNQYLNWLSFLLIGCAGACYQSGYLHRYCLKRVTLMTERRAVAISVVGAKYVGYLVGGISSTVFAEMRAS